MSKKGNSFLKGAAILSIAGILVKILGAIYRIPLTNIIKDSGMGYYQTAYPFYTLLLTLSTAGIPVAIAKLVSQNRAIGDYKSAYKVFKVALVGLIIGGILTSLFVAIGAKPIVDSLGNSNAYYALVALVPALLFVPIMSAFRGFFQGSQNMVPTALSQVVEQLFRVIAGLSLASILLTRGTGLAAGGASFGGSAGAIAGFIAIVYIFFRKRKAIHIEVASSRIDRQYGTAQIVRDLIVIAIPITMGSSIAPIMDTIDAALVLQRLQTINYSEAMANELYGQLKGMAQTLINLPQVFSIAIAMSLVPSISDAFARNSKEDIRKLVSSGIRLTLIIGLPSAFGLFILSEPIISLLYYSNTAETIKSTGEILSYLSFGVIFLTLVQALTAILQGLGKPYVPVRNLFIGAIFKIILTYNLTAIPSVNIKGAAISTVIVYATAATLDFFAVVKYSKLKLNYRNIILKPLVSSVGMALVVKLIYEIFHSLIGGRLVTLIAIGLGVIAYALFLLISGSITENDFELIPNGKKITRKFKLRRFRRFRR